MAASIPSCSFHSNLSPSSSHHHSSNACSTTATPFTLSFPFSARKTYGGVSSSRISAKFERFQGEESPVEENPQSQTAGEEEEEGFQEQKEEDDSCLPSDLEGAVKQSGEASGLFVSSGGMRAIVELLIPQLQFLDDEGAQAELWDLSRVFLETLMEQTGSQRVKAIYPDAGAAAMLKYRWKEAAFGFASLGDRKPVESEDEIVVMVLPDYQMLSSVEKIAASLTDDPPRPLIMWNPRLISEDVGVGINVRNLRRYFLSTFTTVYSMKPLPEGAVFRCYPGLWKVFFDDKARPNRYLLAKEFIRRPDYEEIEILRFSNFNLIKLGSPFRLRQRFEVEMLKGLRVRRLASQGRYLSRSLHQVIKDIIARAIDAASATGVDPYRVWPLERLHSDQFTLKEQGIPPDRRRRRAELNSDEIQPSAGELDSFLPDCGRSFFDDKERPNRYLLAKEFIRRPDYEEIEIIFGNGQEDSEQGPSFFNRAASLFSSINRSYRSRELLVLYIFCS
ncbi:Exocyst complex component EXO84A [Linum perenne]